MLAILKKSLKGLAYLLSIFLSFSLTALVIVTLVQSLALLLLVCIFTVLILPKQLAENIQDFKIAVGDLLQSVRSFAENILAMLHKNKCADMEETANMEAGMEVEVEVDMEQEENLFKEYMAQKEKLKQDKLQKNKLKQDKLKKDKSEESAKESAEEASEKEVLKQNKSGKKKSEKKSKP